MICMHFLWEDGKCRQTNSLYSSLYTRHSHTMHTHTYTHTYIYTYTYHTHTHTLMNKTEIKRMSKNGNKNRAHIWKLISSRFTSSINGPTMTRYTVQF